MNALELRNYLRSVSTENLKLSLMIWGAPGIGKSTIVSEVAKESKREVIDLRLSQLAPTDLRGLPVPDNHKGISRWFPPEFLPTEGKGILFLDELNMAPPAMQGMAQQLILDRKVGSYSLPDEWLVWSAGNRKEDKASVFEMPAPLSNRFIHLNIEADLESFKIYSLAQGLSDQIISFLSFRPELLHKMDENHNAWPSPRTWMMADQLLDIGLDISVCVGEGPAQEFYAFIDIYKTIPDLSEILKGNTKNISFPENPATRYAVVIGLIARMRKIEDGMNAFKWLINNAPPEWVQLYSSDLFKVMREKGTIEEFKKELMNQKEIMKHINKLKSLLDY